MTTEAQINANQINAQKSTGPRTPEGKAKVAQNALKHGLLARQAVIPGEDDEEFDRYRQQMYAELAPVGLVEERLIERIVGLSWRLQRAEWFGTEAFDTLYVQRVLALQVLPEPPCGPDRGDPALGATVVKDFSETRVLERLMVYERRLEGSFYRALGELRSLQRSRGQEGGVGSGPARVDRGTGILPVVEIHGQDAHATETPCGVSTNLPTEPSCETKPICGPGSKPGNTPTGWRGLRWHGLPAHESSVRCRCHGIGLVWQPSIGAMNPTRGCNRRVDGIEPGQFALAWMRGKIFVAQE